MTLPMRVRVFQALEAIAPATCKDVEALLVERGEMPPHWTTKNVSENLSFFVMRGQAHNLGPDRVAGYNLLFPTKRGLFVYGADHYRDTQTALLRALAVTEAKVNSLGPYTKHKHTIEEYRKEWEQWSRTRT